MHYHTQYSVQSGKPSTSAIYVTVIFGCSEEARK